MASGMSAFDDGRSRMWPTQESTTKPLGRYCWIFFDFVGDSTMTSFFAPGEDSLPGVDVAMAGRSADDGCGAKGYRRETRDAIPLRGMRADGRFSGPWDWADAVPTGATEAAPSPTPSSFNSAKASPEEGG